MAASRAFSPVPPELGQILRDHGQDLMLTRDQARVIRALGACRTAALGGHLQRCDHCGQERPLYNSCRNRHCPKCQSLEQSLWVEAQVRNLLPVPYFHTVLTIPDWLNLFFRKDPREAYPLLFAAAAETILAVSRNCLGARPGFIAVLHTWNQILLHHPHIHCIVTGGGLSLDGKTWISSRPRFFLPVRKLSKVFRGKLLEKLETALDTGHLTTPRSTARTLLQRAARKAWVVYCKPPLAGPEQVLRYLGRYTHRIAIGNERLLHYDGQSVTFSYRDRKHANRRKRLPLPAKAFAQRFTLHVVPAHFVRIRHYGLLANNLKASLIPLCRALLDDPAPPQPQPHQPESWQHAYERLVGRDPLLCPACRVGRLVSIRDLPAQPATAGFPPLSARAP